MMVVKASNAKRGSYSDDIPFKELLQCVGVTIVVILVVMAVVGVITVITTAINNKTATETNVSVEQFNSLPLADRQAIIRWDGYEYVPETFLRPYEEVRAWYYPIPPVEEWNVQLIIVVILCVLSLLLLLAYADVKSSEYYLYDLPRSRYGLVLFCLMFAGWVVLLVDFLVAQLCRALERAPEEDDVKTDDENALSGDFRFSDTTAADDDAEADDKEASPLVTRCRPAIEPQPLAEARANYLEFMKEETATRREDQLHEAEKAVGQCKANIDYFNRSIKTEQVKLGEAMAHVQDLKERPPVPEEQMAESAAEDWKIIQNLQGVYRVEYDGYELTVEVRVVVPYEGSYYDFGDFRIVLEGGDYSCHEIRSGWRADAEDLGALYRNGLIDFCFGDRQAEIEEYVQANRYLEALVLMIDCLHWVNEEDRDSIPNGAYQIDPEKDPIISAYWKEE